MAETCPKELMGEISAKGNLEEHHNVLKVFYMPAIPPCDQFPEGLSPKVSHEIVTNDDVRQKPRSFRTGVTEDQARVVLADVRAYLALVDGKKELSPEGRKFLRRELKDRIWREFHV